MISYDRLFEVMKQQGLTTYRIRKDNIISQSALQALQHGGNVTTATIDRLCAALGCQPGEIMEYIPDP